MQNTGLSEESEARCVLPFSRFKPLLALPYLTPSNNNTAECGVVCIKYVFGRHVRERDREQERERKGEANCIFEAANLRVCSQMSVECVWRRRNAPPSYLPRADPHINIQARISPRVEFFRLPAPPSAAFKQKKKKNPIQLPRLNNLNPPGTAYTLW